MQGCECKIYLWWCQCPITEMQMQIFIFRYKNAPCGYVMNWMPPCGCVMMQIPPGGYVTMQMLFSWRKCNLTNKFFCFPNRGFLGAWNQNAFKTRFTFFQRLFIFISRRLECPVHHSCPKNMFYLGLRFPKRMVITSVGVILGRGIEGNYQAQRGDYKIIFLYQWKDDERWSFFISNIVT